MLTCYFTVCVGSLCFFMHLYVLLQLLLDFTEGCLFVYAEGFTGAAPSAYRNRYHTEVKVNVWSAKFRPSTKGETLDSYSQAHLHTLS